MAVKDGSGCVVVSPFSSSTMPFVALVVVAVAAVTVCCCGFVVVLLCCGVLYGVLPMMCVAGYRFPVEVVEQAVSS